MADINLLVMRIHTICSFHRRNQVPESLYTPYYPAVDPARWRQPLYWPISDNLIIETSYYPAHIEVEGSRGRIIGFTTDRSFPIALHTCAAGSVASQGLPADRFWLEVP